YVCVTFLLCLSCWISGSVSEFYAVEVQHGKKVTLRCSNFSIFPSHIYWFKLTNKFNVTCISSMFSADRKPSVLHGFQAGKFNMTSNTSVLFLEIKQVDFSDAGLYFCGEYKDGKSVISSGTYLIVFLVEVNLTSVILGSLIVFLLLVIISLIVKIKNFHKGIFRIYLNFTYKNCEEITDRCVVSNVDSGATNYAALSFHPRPNIRRPESQRELEPNVVYAATR
uniref:Ig-like domain-containing protein n=1 Tax=Amphilophus citrinellus TaxID=61819 RepID=A0A3Q0RGW6_AMPCI